MPVDAVERAHWRRQLVLTGVAAGVVVLALGVLALLAGAGRAAPVSELRLGRDGHVHIAHPAEDVYRIMMWPAVAGLLAMAGVLAAVVAHTVRVAGFIFRRGERG